MAPTTDEDRGSASERADQSSRRLAALTAYGALGPITGPLIAGLVRNLRAGNILLAALYVIAVAGAWMLLSVAAAHLARQI
jgi:hypothetical protein